MRNLQCANFPYTSKCIFIFIISFLTCPLTCKGGLRGGQKPDLVVLGRSLNIHQQDFSDCLLCTNPVHFRCYLKLLWILNCFGRESFRCPETRACLVIVGQEKPRSIWLDWSGKHDDIIKFKHFRVTSHLCAEFTGPRWIPLTKASDAEPWRFLWSASE